MFLQNSVPIPKKSVNRPFLDNYYKKDPECGSFLDFQRFFNTVYRKIFLPKLGFYGIKGVPYDLIKSYLTSRKYYTHINGVG